MLTLSFAILCALLLVLTFVITRKAVRPFTHTTRPSKLSTYTPTSRQDAIAYLQAKPTDLLREADSLTIL